VRNGKWIATTEVFVDFYGYCGHAGLRKIDEEVARTRIER
jgi:hypothetical protein